MKEIQIDTNTDTHIPISQALPLKLLRVRESFMEYFRPIVKKHNITEQQWRVIRYLIEHSDSTNIEKISRKACISSPSLTGILHRMERDGFITRRGDTKDRRKTYITLTEKSRQLYQIVYEESQIGYQQLAKDLGDNEIKAIDGMLSIIIEKLDQQNVK